ncbi:hypothetical protein DFP73DRAFT_591677 [Morchella snyderi]|nr:hypothetical protein DFP73DRAFT_591677 [Morchella snyderi]
MTLHKILGDILDGLRSPGQSGELIPCADGFERLCYPILFAWIANHPEHAALLNINNHACPRCEVDSKGLGGLQQGALRIQERYMEMAERYKIDTFDNTPVEYLVSKCIKTMYNAFWALPRVNVYDLHKPDILHNLYLGQLKHMMGWVQLFLKKHKRIEEFDQAWASVGPYPGLAVPNKSYCATTQWQGKEMRHLGRKVLGAFAVALWKPPAALKRDFGRALKCGYLEEFHTHKDVFLEFRAHKRTKKDAKDRTRALEGPVSLERGLEELEEIRKGSHFNFIKMHLLSHFRDHVERFGNIPMFSTDVRDLVHKQQIKKA